MMDAAKLLAKLDASDAICAAATDGQWIAEKTIIHQFFPSINSRGVLIGSACGYTGSGFFPDDEAGIRNAALIAHARTELPTRNQQLREALSRIAELEAVVVPLERLLSMKKYAKSLMLLPTVSIQHESAYTFGENEYFVDVSIDSDTYSYAGETLAEALSAAVKAMEDAT